MSDLHVEEHGSGVPVVWIHGFPLSSVIFRRQMSIEGVRHLTPDLPGFGSTPPLPFDRIDQYADVVIELLESRRIDRAVFAGVSMGGYVLFSILRKRLELATGLLLIDTREGEDTAEGRANRLAQIEQVGKTGTNELIEGMLPKMLTAQTLDESDARAEIVRQAMESATVEGVQSALRAMASRPDSSDVLRNAPCPVLIAVGSHDEITPPADARRMASLVSSHVTVVEIPNAAHLSNVERPDEFNTAVANFLAGLE